MYLNPTIKKSISVTLLLCFLNNIIAPGLSFALTSGPENPNATSFEPVDTTDMVNLFNGDLAYNIPLLEVPGPEGGYPLSLSYHAGIMPGAEASWVGLGWTLNPGAINRTVNGFPDDFNGQESVVRDYWKGGKKTTTSVGVNIGIIGALSAEVGLTVAHDTFLGTGIGGYLGLSAGLDIGSGVQASSSIGLAINPFGGTSIYGGIGLGATIGKSGSYSIGGGVGLGFTANSSGTSVGAGASISASATKGGKSMSTSLLGASIASGGNGMSFSGIGGYSNIKNVNAGRIQTQSSGWGITVPVWIGVSISLKRNYLRYWSDETSAVSTYGSLNYPDNIYLMYKQEFDTYYLPDVTDSSYSLLGSNDPMNTNGGTFPDYDAYTVLGQGIGGSIRPYGYQLQVFGKASSSRSGSTNRISTTEHTEMIEVWDSYEERFYWQENNYTIDHTENPTKLNFKFTNDFSNSFVQENTDISNKTMIFDLNPKYGNNDGNYGYDPQEERLASSRNVEYFSNDEIKSGAAKLKGFIDNKARGFIRGSHPNQTSISGEDKRIGGFMITNESGMTYHYSLPVYAYNEVSRTESVSGIETYNTQTRNNPYATSWMLTAVTGPDYVDINENGLADKNDWGYWVTFEYGKWSENYSWRNPGVGFKKELDSRFRYYSKGKKEMYYLDAVITPSHTAIFEKEIRADSKGVGHDNGYTHYDGLPTSELRLNNIILYKNSDLDLDLYDIRNGSTKYTESPVHQGAYIVDKFDLENKLKNKEAILKKINFNFDYTLCPNVPNSYDDKGLIYEKNTNAISTEFQRLGKLTLKKLSFLGKGGESSIPSMNFEYDLPEDLVRKSDRVSFLGKKSNSNIYKFSISNVNKGSREDFKEADIIKFNVNGTFFYGLIKQVEELAAGGSYFTKNMEVKFLGLNPPITEGSNVYSWSSTKNPPFVNDNYDIWGLFKADYQDIAGNDNLSRLPSKASAQSSDVWSLRRIHHSLGMTTDIEYESDNYSRVALYRNAAVQVASVEKKPNALFKVNSVADFGIDLRDFIRVGDKIELTLAGNYIDYKPTIKGGVEIVNNVSMSSGGANLLVAEVGENYVLINNPFFYNELFYIQKPSPVLGGNMSAGGIGNNFGGGIRVKKVINSEPITGVKMAVNYNYNRPDQTQISSGTTAYEPLGVDMNVRIGNYEPYQKVMLKSFSTLLGMVRDIPAPGVMYEFVSVSSERTAEGETVQQYGKSQYQFEVFNEGMVSLAKENQGGDNTSEYSKVTLQNYTSRIGNLRRIVKFDVDGNKLSESINHYLHDKQTGNSAKSNKDEYGNLMAKYDNQGVIMERIAEGRFTNGKSRRVISMRTNYPTIQTGSTSIDYKTGIKSSSQILAYDFYSGQPIKTLTIDGMGNRFISEKKPAYRVYPEMGLKFKNLKNAHMLSQVAEEITYKVDENNIPTSILSAHANSWSNQMMMLNDAEQFVNTKTAHSSSPNIWRPYKSYQWLPESRVVGTTNLQDFSSLFNGGIGLPGWSLMSEVTLYNKYSTPLEVKDLYGNYSSTKMGYNQSKVVVSASSSNYHEMNYTGMEDGLISSGLLFRGFSLGGAQITSEVSHTGTKSAKIGPKQEGVFYNVNTSKLTPGRNYSASVWMKNIGDPTSSNLYYRINGGAKTLGVVSSKKKAGEWYQVTLQIPGVSLSSNAALEVGCVNTGLVDSYFDDLRIKPINSSMNSYVYNDRSGELEYVLDDNNMFTKFQYDHQGRLIKTFRETFGYGVKLISENIYNYANSLNPVWQSTGNTRCQQVNSSYNGLKEAEQRDINAFSPSFNQVKWIVIGSSSECGANPTNCSGYDKKYINGVCETGRKEFVKSVPNRPTIGFRCHYVYYFSDGSKGEEFIEFSPVECWQ